MHTHRNDAKVVGKGLCRVLTPEVFRSDSIVSQRLEEEAEVSLEVPDPVSIQRYLEHWGVVATGKHVHFRSLLAGCDMLDIRFGL